MQQNNKIAAIAIILAIAALSAAASTTTQLVNGNFFVEKNDTNHVTRHYTDTGSGLADTAYCITNVTIASTKFSITPLTNPAQYDIQIKYNNTYMPGGKTSDYTWFTLYSRGGALNNTVIYDGITGIIPENSCYMVVATDYGNSVNLEYWKEYQITVNSTAINIFNSYNNYSTNLSILLNGNTVLQNITQLNLQTGIDTNITIKNNGSTADISINSSKNLLCGRLPVGWSGFDNMSDHVQADFTAATDCNPATGTKTFSKNSTGAQNTGEVTYDLGKPGWYTVSERIGLWSNTGTVEVRIIGSLDNSSYLTFQGPASFVVTSTSTSERIRNGYVVTGYARYIRFQTTSSTTQWQNETFYEFVVSEVSTW